MLFGSGEALAAGESVPRACSVLPERRIKTIQVTLWHQSRISIYLFSLATDNR